MSTPPPANLYGRRAGRGLRPWLLVPKVLALGGLFGGLVAAWVATVAAQPPARDAAAWQAWLSAVGAVFRYLVVPASLAAALLGALLLLQAPRVLLAQRWLRVKLLVLILFLPPLHFLARHQFHRLRAVSPPPADAPGDAPASALPFTACLVAAVLVVAAVIALARVKPRLGQNWARTYERLGRRPPDVTP